MQSHFSTKRIDCTKKGYVFDFYGMDTIGYDKMKMRVKIESRAKILDKADGSNLSLGDMGATSDKSFSDLFNDNLEDVLENTY